MYILSQLPVPTEGDNAWMWLCGILVGAIGIMWKHSNDSTKAENTTLRDERDRERARNDVLLNSIPEMVTVLRELKNALLNRPQE